MCYNCDLTTYMYGLCVLTHSVHLYLLHLMLIQVPKANERQQTKEAYICSGKEKNDFYIKDH